MLTIENRSNITEKNNKNVIEIDTTNNNYKNIVKVNNIINNNNNNNNNHTNKDLI